MIYEKSPLKKYRSQKAKAKQRGIEFTLTFEEWWDIWQQSGKWDQRGVRKGQYVMSRLGDTGGYTLGNVMIQTAADNNREAYSIHQTPPMQNKKHKPETKNKFKGRTPWNKGLTKRLNTIN